MPINSSILRTVRTPKTRDPIEGAMTALQLRSAMLGNQANEMQLAGAQRQQQREAQVRAVLEKHGGNIERALPDLYSVDTGFAVSMSKQLREFKKLEADIAQSGAAAKASEATTAKSQEDLEQSRQKARGEYFQALPRIGKQGQFAAYSARRPGAIRAEYYTPEELPETEPEIQQKYGPDWATVLGGGPDVQLMQEQRLQEAAQRGEVIDEFPNKAGKRVFAVRDRTGNIVYQEGPEVGAEPRAQVPGTDIPLRADVASQRVSIAAASRAPQAPEPPEAVIGPDGKPVLVLRSQSYGKTPAPSSSNRPPTEGERTALRFYERMKGAVDDLARVEEEIAGLKITGQTQLEYAPNIFQSRTNQIYRQAQRAFTEARLRKDSGAAIPETEFENDRRTYFVQPGDKPEVIEQKRRARETAMNALRRSAARAYEETYGEHPATLGRRLDESSALEFLQKAGGDRDKARRLAKEAGYVWD